MKLVRPRDLSEDKRKELVRYLMTQWERARDGRTTQVDDDYQRWDKNYRGIPREAVRSLPWKGSSNFVVKLIRMHLDTFVARTLGIVFATQPLVKVTGYKSEITDPLEKYINFKALYQWDAYRFGREYLIAGNKTGTATAKIPWIDEKTIDIRPGDSEGSDYTETEISSYLGPRLSLIPFEDYYVYPITATTEDQIQIRFHRLRYSGEQVKELCESGVWAYPFEDEKTPDSNGSILTKGLRRLLKKPTDVKRTQEQQDAGVVDADFDELQVIECHLRYPISNDPTKYYDIVPLLVPDAKDFVDVYFNPYPRNLPIFPSYRPFPRDGLWYGESMCEILEQSQEEASQIHNDRRNNSYLANAPMFKRRTGSLVPNASTTAWPGKVWDLENMEDFEVIMAGRNYNDMLQEETFDLQLSERLSGVGALSQGQASGMTGKRGVYSAQGTMALISESNERQNTNIRDYRQSLGHALKTGFLLQAHFGADDPALEFFPAEEQGDIRKALEFVNQSELRLHLCPFDIRTSTAAMNKEIERQNLMQMAGVLNQYYQQVNQAAQMLLNKDINPGLRMIINDVVSGQKYIAKRLLRAFDEMDPEGVLPNVSAAIERVIPGGSRGSHPDEETEYSGGAMDAGEGQPGGAPPAQGPLSRSGLENLLALPGGNAGMGGGRAA